MIDGKPEFFAVYWTTQRGVPATTIYVTFKEADALRRELTSTQRAIHDGDRLLGHDIVQPQAKGSVRIARFVGEWL